jgi:translation initiation factor 2 beta subunit (eIF-2beta)/eIF-5
MGCCRKSRKPQQKLTSKEVTSTMEEVSPIVYVLCRHCGLMVTLRLNLAADLMKLACKTCGNKRFHTMKTIPSPEVLRKLIIKE